MEYGIINKEFGQLLSGAIASIAHYEGKLSPIVEAEFGELIAVSRHTINRYKRGHLPPEKEAVKIMAEECMKRGYLTGRWLAKFLRFGSYPQAAAVVDKYLDAERAAFASMQR